MYGRQSGVVAEKLADTVLADERQQALMDITKLGLGRILLPNHGDAATCFIQVEGADRIVPKIVQQLQAVARILAQLFAQFTQMLTVLGRMTEHTSSRRKRSGRQRKQSRIDCQSKNRGCQFRVTTPSKDLE